MTETTTKRGAFWRLLDRLVIWRNRRFCSHEFAIEDLKKTGMMEPRVRWPCAKCGTAFYAHCGLDISPSHGAVFRRQPYNAANHRRA